MDYNLRALEKGGYIRRAREISSGIHGSGKRSRVIPVPIIGTIAAGQPIPVPTDTDTSETIDVTPEMVGNRENVFALRVKGNSMIDALVNDGDIVLIEQTPTARNGEMVAVYRPAPQEKLNVTEARLLGKRSRIWFIAATPSRWSAATLVRQR